MWSATGCFFFFFFFFEKFRGAKTDTGGSLCKSAVDRYLHLMQETLINAIYQDRAIDPWSPPVFDDRKRDGDWTGRTTLLTMIGGARLRSFANAASWYCESKSRATSSKPVSGAAVPAS